MKVDVVDRVICSETEGWLSFLWGSDCARAGDAPVRPTEAHVQPRRVTGLKSWWGAAAIRSGQHGLQRHPPPPTPRPPGWPSPVVSEGRPPHIGQTTDRASRPAGPWGCLPTESVRASLLPA